MRVIQLLPTIAYGDAVGNDAVALDKLIRSMGYETAIFAENIDERIQKLDIAKYYDVMPKLGKNDFVFYHFSTGSKVMKELLLKLDCHKVMIYHNITPSVFFEQYSPEVARLVQSGRNDLKAMKEIFERCLADSEYNKDDLIKVGFTCPIDVLPILIPMGDYDKKPSEDIIKKYNNNGWTNILFVGRISPNKKQEDIIRVFTYYKKYINKKARLFVVGNYQGMEIYYDRLLRYVATLGVVDVIFTGHTSFDQILAYYKIANIFLCMSEHEGFCVPLVEAMKFNIPVIAYDSSAIPQTLGGAGIVIDTKDPYIISMLIQKIQTDKSFKKEILKSEAIRLKYFSYEYVSSLTKLIINQLLGKEPNYNLMDSSNTTEDAIKKLDINNTVTDFLKEIGMSNPSNIVMTFNKISIEPSSIKSDNHTGIKDNSKNRILKYGYKILSVNCNSKLNKNINP